jgi:hypothetical protein
LSGCACASRLVAPKFLEAARHSDAIRDSVDARGGSSVTLPRRLITSASCIGSTIRTAISASRRRRFSTSFERTSSISSSGYRSRSEEKIGGRISAPAISLALIRTVPLMAWPWPAMVALVTRGVDGLPLGIHRTFLAHDGLGKTPVEPTKMMLGPCRGGVGHDAK